MNETKKNEDFSEIHDEQRALPKSGAALAQNLGVVAFPDSRCPCVLLLDASESMKLENRFTEMKNGIEFLRQELMRDSLAAKRVELQIILFGTEGDTGVQIINNFQTVNQFVLPPIQVNPRGWTPIGDGVMAALSVLEQRKAFLKSAGIEYLRPWIFMVTDGRPSGPNKTEDLVFESAIEALHSAEVKNKVVFHGVMVSPNLSLNYLERLCLVNPPRHLLPGMWNEMFQWLSTSLERLSHGLEDTVEPLPTPWAQEATRR